MAILDTKGLVVRRYPEIYKTISTSLRNNVSNDIVTDEDTVLGQIVSIFAKELATMEDMLQHLYDCYDRDKAEGAALDGLLYLVGLERNIATPSRGVVSFICRPETAIPKGLILENTSSGDRFETTELRRATPTLCQQVWYSVKPPRQDAATTLYNFNINLKDYSYTANKNEPHEDVVKNIIRAINGWSMNEVDFEKDSENDFFKAHLTRIQNEDVIHIETKTYSGIQVLAVQHLEPVQVLVDVFTEAQTKGRVVVPAKAISRWLTGVSGILEVYNPETFGLGSDRESDEDFRARAEESLVVSGSSTWSAVYTALTNIPEVSSLVLIENTSPLPHPRGLPPHSFEAVVKIPKDPETIEKVANVIWQNKPLGIASYGNINGWEGVQVEDANYDKHTVYFSTPEEVPMEVRVEYTFYEEERPSINLREVIQKTVLDFFYSLDTDIDVIPKRIAADIYKKTSGLDDVVVTVRKKGKGSYTKNRVDIGHREIATLLKEDILITTV